jgi:hypothetical protein
MTDRGLGVGCGVWGGRGVEVSPWDPDESAWPKRNWLKLHGPSQAGCEQETVINGTNLDQTRSSLLEHARAAKKSPWQWARNAGLGGGGVSVHQAQPV